MNKCRMSCCVQFVWTWLACLPINASMATWYVESHVVKQYCSDDKPGTSSDDAAVLRSMRKSWTQALLCLHGGCLLRDLRGKLGTCCPLFLRPNKKCSIDISLDSLLILFAPVYAETIVIAAHWDLVLFAIRSCALEALAKRHVVQYFYTRSTWTKCVGVCMPSERQDCLTRLLLPAHWIWLG